MRVVCRVEGVGDQCTGGQSSKPCCCSTCMSASIGCTHQLTLNCFTDSKNKVRMQSWAQTAVSCCGLRVYLTDDQVGISSGKALFLGVRHRPSGSPERAKRVIPRCLQYCNVQSRVLGNRWTRWVRHARLFVPGTYDHVCSLSYCVM